MQKLKQSLAALCALMALCFNFAAPVQQTRAASTTTIPQTDNNVTVKVELTYPDNEIFNLGEKIPEKVHIKNENTYPIYINDLKLTMPNHMQILPKGVVTHEFLLTFSGMGLNGMLSAKIAYLDGKKETALTLIKECQESITNNLAKYSNLLTETAISEITTAINNLVNLMDTGRSNDEIENASTTVTNLITSKDIFKPEALQNATVAAKVGATPGERTIDAEVDFTYTAWQTVDIHGTNYKIGVQAYSDVIAHGSEFNVACYDSDDTGHAGHLRHVDKTHGEFENIAFFDITVKKPYPDAENPNYTELKDSSGNKSYAKIYIQIPDGWDDHELEAIYVNENNDETYVEGRETVTDDDDNEIRCVTFTTSHFSPYSLYDPIDNQSENNPPPTNPPQNPPTNIPQSAQKPSGTSNGFKTGEAAVVLSVAFLAVSIAALLILLAIRQKSSKNLLAILLCTVLAGLVAAGSGVALVVSVANHKPLETKTVSVTPPIPPGGVGTIPSEEDSLLDTPVEIFVSRDSIDDSEDSEDVPFIFPVTINDLTADVKKFEPKATDVGLHVSLVYNGPSLADPVVTYANETDVSNQDLGIKLDESGRPIVNVGVSSSLTNYIDNWEGLVSVSTIPAEENISSTSTTATITISDKEQLNTEYTLSLTDKDGNTTYDTKTFNTYTPSFADMTGGSYNTVEGNNLVGFSVNIEDSSTDLSKYDAHVVVENIPERWQGKAILTDESGKPIDGQEKTLLTTANPEDNEVNIKYVDNIGTAEVTFAGLTYNNEYSIKLVGVDYIGSSNISAVTYDQTDEISYAKPTIITEIEGIPLLGFAQHDEFSANAQIGFNLANIPSFWTGGAWVACYNAKGNKVNGKATNITDLTGGAYDNDINGQMKEGNTFTVTPTDLGSESSKTYTLCLGPTVEVSSGTNVASKTIKVSIPTFDKISGGSGEYPYVKVEPETGQQTYKATVIVKNIPTGWRGQVQLYYKVGDKNQNENKPVSGEGEYTFSGLTYGQQYEIKLLGPTQIKKEYDDSKDFSITYATTGALPTVKPPTPQPKTVELSATNEVSEARNSINNTIGISDAYYEVEVTATGFEGDSIKGTYSYNYPTADNSDVESQNFSLNHKYGTTYTATLTNIPAGVELEVTVGEVKKTLKIEKPYIKEISPNSPTTESAITVKVAGTNYENAYLTLNQLGRDDSSNITSVAFMKSIPLDKDASESLDIPNATYSVSGDTITFKNLPISEYQITLTKTKITDPATGYTAPDTETYDVDTFTVEGQTAGGLVPALQFSTILPSEGNTEDNKMGLEATVSGIDITESNGHTIDYTVTDFTVNGVHDNIGESETTTNVSVKEKTFVLGDLPAGAKINLTLKDSNGDILVEDEYTLETPYIKDYQIDKFSDPDTITVAVNEGVDAKKISLKILLDDVEASGVTYTTKTQDDGSMVFTINGLERTTYTFQLLYNGIVVDVAEFSKNAVPV